MPMEYSPEAGPEGSGVGRRDRRVAVSVTDLAILPNPAPVSHVGASTLPDTRALTTRVKMENRCLS